MEERYIRIRWQGNNSSKYDDTIQDVPFKHISEDDIPSLAVGGVVHVQMGRAKRKWTGIVVDMLNDEDIAEQLVSSDSDDEESDNEALIPPPKKQKASKASGKAGGKAGGKASGRGKGNGKQKTEVVVVHADSPIATPSPAAPLSAAKKAASQNSTNDMPIQQLSEMLCTIQQNQALMMQKLLAPPPATLAPPPAPRRIVNFEPFKSGPSSSYLEPSTSYQQPNTSYKQPSTSYKQPSTSYQQPNTNYQQPNTSYKQPSTSYQQPNTSYQQPNTSYQQPNTSYQQPQFFPGYQENRSSPKMLSTPPAIHTPPTRSQAPKETDKEVLWARCKVAIGNKRKQLRSNKRL